MRLNTCQKAQLAITNRLFINQWNLRDDLEDAKLNPNMYDIRLEWRDKKPVGVAVLHKNTGLVLLFVRKQWRRRGIGTKLINRFKGKAKEAGYGVVGSKEFFESVNLSLEDYYW